MSIEELANSVLPWRWKSAEVLRDEVDEEIRFHLEERARELEGTGLSRADARAEAARRFGDVERTKLDCLTVQMGERIMLQKIQWFVIGVLSLGLVLLGLSYLATVRQQQAMIEEARAVAEANLELARRNEVLAQERLDAAIISWPEGTERVVAESTPPTPEEVTSLWRRRFAEKPDDWRHGLATAQALVAELEPDEALRVLTEIWPELSDDHKRQSLKAFAFQHGHPATLAVMHLGATDGAHEVQNRALHYLQNYAFQSFEDDYEAYFAWHGRWKDTPLADVMAENAREFVASLHGKGAEELLDPLRNFDRLDLRAGTNVGVDLAAVFREAGAIDLIEAWLTSADADTRSRAFSWARSLDPGEPWLRDHMLPCVTEATTGDDQRASAALRTLASRDNDWIVPHVIEYLERTVPLTTDDTPHSGIWSAAQALAEVADPVVIPTLIGLIASNPCYDTTYGIGYFGLGKLTGVTYDETHDGDWWIDWWGKNQSRFPAHVRGLAIPDYGRR